MIAAIGAFFSGLFSRIWTFLASVDWVKAYRAASLFLFPVAIYLAVSQWSEARHEHKLLVQEQGRVVKMVGVHSADVAAHEVTKKSLRDMMAERDAANARSEAAHKMLLDQEAYWQSKDAENVARFKDTAATVAQLEKGAAGKRDVPCKLSAGALRALDGL